MKHIRTKTKLLFVPLVVLAFVFITTYSFLYWLLHIKLDVLSLQEDVMHLWTPMTLSFLCILLFIRPRVHLLKLDKDNGRIRGLYYIISSLLLFIPTLFLLGLLDTATGKLTKLDSITEISKKPVTKYYKPNSYVLHKGYIGVKPVMSYSGKHNQYLNFNIYIALPFTGDLYDTLQSPAAFLYLNYHEQISSKIDDVEREARWEVFWKQSFESFDKDHIYFSYLERMANTEQRNHAIAAARKSGLYKSSKPVTILKPVNEPFDERNGNKLLYGFLSFGIGLVVWFIMIGIPGLHVNKAAKFTAINTGYLQKEVKETYQIFKPEYGFAATPVLIALNVLMFVILAFYGSGFFKFYNRDLVSLGALYEPLVRQGQWWRLFTCMFLHTGILHLFMNMASLYLTGMLLERITGSGKFLAGYLISGIVAAWVSLWWHEEPVVAAGASGAVFGLYGMLLALAVSKLFDTSTKKMFLILLAGTAGYSLLMGFLSEGIDNSAHVGGLAAGLLIGFIYVRVFLRNRMESNGSLYKACP